MEQHVLVYPKTNKEILGDALDEENHVYHA